MTLPTGRRLIILLPLMAGVIVPNREIEAQLSAIKRMPRLIRSFFKAPSVAYVTDW